MNYLWTFFAMLTLQQLLVKQSNRGKDGRGGRVLWNTVCPDKWPSQCYRERTNERLDRGRSSISRYCSVPGFEKVQTKISAEFYPTCHRYFALCSL